MLERERERERERETDRQTDRQTETERQRQRDRDCFVGASLDVHTGKNLFSKFDAPSIALFEALSVTLVSSVS